MSGTDDVEIKNKQTNFQNYLQDRFYLDQNAQPLGLALTSLSVDHPFHNLICSLGDSYPQLIVCTLEYIQKPTKSTMKEETNQVLMVEGTNKFEIQVQKYMMRENSVFSEGRNVLTIFDFTNDQKFYLKSHK